MKIFRLSKIIIRCVEHNLNYLFNRIIYPQFVVFYATYRCNSHCKACNIWKGDDNKKLKTELTCEEIREIFSNPLFKKVVRVNIQGGEATLREDLFYIVKILIEKLPRLEVISLTSNGLDTKNVVNQVKKILRLCKEHNVKFNIALSIDGVGSYHDFARGRDAFKKVSSTIVELKKIKEQFPEFGIGTNCVITANNIYNINEIEKWQNKVFGYNNITVVEFREHFLNNPTIGYSLLFEKNEKEKQMFIQWLTKKILEKPHYILQFRYDQIKNMLSENKDRTQSCQYLINSVVVNQKGVFQQCPIGGVVGSLREGDLKNMYFSKETKEIRNKLIKSKCKKCYPYNFYRCEFEKDLVKYLYWRLKKNILRIKINEA